MGVRGLDKGPVDMTADRDTTEAELSAVPEYYSKIKASGIAKLEMYEAASGGAKQGSKVSPRALCTVRASRSSTWTIYATLFQRRGASATAASTSATSTR